MFKGYRTYIAGIGGMLTGASIIVTCVATGDYGNFGEGISVFFISAAQVFQRAATN